MEGDEGVAFAAGHDAMSEQNFALSIEPGEFVSYGAWLRDVAGLTGVIFGAAGPNGWYVLMNDNTGQFRCELLEFGGGVAGQVSVATPAPGVWSHVACVYSGTELSIYIDGVPGGSSSEGLDRAAEMSELSVLFGSGVSMEVDEAFFAPGALDAPTIRRIASCGLDGKRCLCDPEAPHEYFSPGTFGSGEDLAPCDALTPGL